MLAFAFYFISKIAQVYHLIILNRERFLSIWIVIFASMGLYFMGVIRFSGDSPMAHIGVPRFLLSMAALVFAVYLASGFAGNQLKALNTYCSYGNG
jgi:thiol:disulfide interchange protein DsbD